MDKVNAIRASVIEVLPAGLYRVQIGSKEYLCYLAGKLKLNQVRVLIGDEVDVVLDPYGGKATNRIVFRHKDKSL